MDFLVAAYESVRKFVISVFQRACNKNTYILNWRTIAVSFGCHLRIYFKYVSALTSPFAFLTGDHLDKSDLNRSRFGFVGKRSGYESSKCYQNICFFSLQFFWAIGSCFTVGVAMAVMPSLGWRWLLGFLSLPLLLFVAMSYVSKTEWVLLTIENFIIYC